jgi:hypothetical protein
MPTSVLSELGEGIEDEWSYVNDLTDTWRTRFDEVAARHGDDDASMKPARRSIGHRRDPADRGPTPRHRLAVDLPPGGPRCGRGQTVRFQDAARDARAVVYAGIQADPQVARTATLLADATPVQRLLARAVMNGETVDPAGWRTMFPTLFGPAATGDADDLARSEAILEASLAVADRGEQVRSQVRGALIEEVTAQLLARRVGQRRSIASGGSCSMAFPPRSTRTT